MITLEEAMVIRKAVKRLVVAEIDHARKEIHAPAVHTAIMQELEIARLKFEALLPQNPVKQRKARRSTDMPVTKKI